MKTFTFLIRLFASLLVASGTLMFQSYGQVSITTFGTPYNQNFNTLGNSGADLVWVNNSTLAGWYTNEWDNAYDADSGWSPVKGLFSFGLSPASDRALGSVAGPPAAWVTFGVRIANNTGFEIVSFGIAYTGEQWRCANSAAQLLDFQYMINADSITNPGPWTDVDPLDFSSPQTCPDTGWRDGNNAINRAFFGPLGLTVTVNAGDEIWFRWVDNDDFNDEHGLAVDDLSITANCQNSSTPSSANAAPSTLCNGSSTTITVSGGALGSGAAWKWYSGSCGGIPEGVGPSIIVSPAVTNTYYVRAEGVCNTTACVSTTVTVNQNPTVSLSQTNITCNGLCNGSVTATPSGGTAPYTYNWSNSGVTQTINALCTGTYTVTVTDNKGCTVTSNATVTQPSILVTTNSVANVTCNGQCDGALTTNPSGGIPPYTYNWTGGGVTQTINSLCAANYTVTVTDNNGCTTDVASSVTQPSALITINSVTNVSCNGQCTGSITTSPSGGTAPYTYNWSNSGVTQTINTLCAGTYTVTVTDNKGCTTTAISTVTEPTVLITSAGLDQSICDGGNTILNGGFPSATGGTPPYTYSWNPTSGLSSATDANPTASPTGTTAYNLSVTDVNGCPSPKDTVSVFVNPLATVSAGIDAAICQGSTYTLSGSIGGGASSSTWTTSGTGSFDNPALVGATYTPSGSDIASGTVTLTITTDDPAGPCLSVTDNMMLTIDQAATASAGVDGTICEGSSYTLSGIRGGSATSSTWSTSGTGTFDDNTLLGAVYTPSAGDISAGTVTLTLTTNDPAGPCLAASDNMVLTINLAATVSAGLDATICEGSIYPLSGTRGGGSSNSTWTTSGTGSFDNPALVGATYTPSGSDIASGTVTLTITTDDPAGPCLSVTDNMMLTIDPAATASAGVDGTICEGSSYTLSGTRGGSATSSTWSTSGSGTFDDNTLLGAVYTPSAGDISMGTVTLTITTNDPDGGGPCSAASDAMILTINSSSTAPTSATASINPTCGGSTTLSIIGGSLGTGAAWQWYSGTCGGTFIGSGTSLIVSPAVTTTYYSRAEGTCNTTTCVITTVTVNSYSTAATSVSAVPNPVCSGNSSTLNVIGGSLGTGANWQWYSGSCGGTFAGSGSALVVSPSSTTTYYVRAEGTCNTTTCVSVTVTVNTLSATPTGISASVNPVCLGGSTTLSVVGGSLGTGANWFWYSGSCGGTFEGNGPTLNISPAATKFYYVRAEGTCNSTSCGTSLTVTVDQPPTTSSAGPDQDLCNITSATLSGNTPGTGSGNWSVVSGTATIVTPSSPTSTVSGLIAGTSATLRWTISSGSCPLSTDDMVISIYDLPSANAGADAAVCSGNTFTTSGSIGGSASSSAWSSSGTGSFDNPVLLNATYTPSAGDIVAGSVSLALTTDDPAGPCLAGSDTMILTINPNPTVTTSKTDVLCNGGSDGTATASPSGGTSPYTYVWDDPAPAQSTPTATGLSAGTFNVTLTDANGCATTGSSIINEPAALVLTTGSVNSTCGNSDGQVNVNATGGISPYIYNWSSGCLTDTCTGLAAGSYTVTVTDANGCTVAGVSNVNNTGGPSVTITLITDVSCNGGINGSIDITPSGGTAPYTFIWSNSAFTEDITGLSAGVYTVTATDALGCNAISSATVTEPNILTVTSDISPQLCKGTSISNSATANGGTTPYSFSITAGALPTGILMSGLGAISGTPTTTGVYTFSFMATDGNGCIATDPRSVTVNPVYNTPVSATICNGDSIFTGGNYQNTAGTYYDTLQTINGCDSVIATTLTVNPATSTPASAAICSGDSIYLQGNYQTSAGTYYDTLSTINGCDSIIETTLTIQSITLSVSSSDATCYGCNDGSITANVNGGTTPYSYLWSNGATNSIAAAVGSGSYTVTVTDANSCSATATATVTEPPPVSVVATVTANNATCFGSCNGDATAAAAGGTPPYTYLWSTGGTANSVSGLCAGSYSVIVQDNSAGADTVSFAITEPTLLTATATATDVTSCGLQDGSTALTVAGGTTPYSFNWSNGAATEDLLNISGGYYYVVVTDANGCTVTNFANVTQPSALVLSATAADATACNASDGSVDLTVSGGAPPYSFLWSNGATTEDLTGVPSGNYSATVKDAVNCQGGISAVVNEPPAFTLSFTSAGVKCSQNCDGSILVTPVGGVAPFTYLWDDNLHQNTALATGLCAGNYSVLVNDANGCVVTGASSVTVPSPLALSITSTDATFCGGADGTASVTVTGGTPPYEFSWSNGSTANSTNNLPGGIHYVTVLDSNDCVAYGTVTVNDAGGPVISVGTVFNLNCAGVATGAIDISVSGGLPPYTYIWSNAHTTQDISALMDGVYDVQVTDATGCNATQSVTVTAPPVLTVSVTTVNATCGSTDGSASLNVSGGVTPYAYQWSVFSTSSTIIGLGAGSYGYTVTDANYCTRTGSAVVSDNGGPAVTVDSINHIGCGDSLTGAIYISVSGGTAPYNYLWSNGETTDDLINIAMGEYSLLVNDSNGCSSAFSDSVRQDPPQPDPICLVTVDSATGFNRIVWTKVGIKIAYYNVYRELGNSGNFVQIGTVSYADESSYLDTMSNPNAKSWRYKLGVVDSCGKESEFLAPMHKTMFLNIYQAGPGIVLVWDPYYGFYFTDIVIYRGTAPDSLFPLDTIPAGGNSYFDGNPPSSIQVYYLIAAIHPTGCTALKLKTYNSSKSNTASMMAPTRLQKPAAGSFGLLVYPNPANNHLVISFEGDVRGNRLLEIYDMRGDKLFSNPSTGTGKVELVVTDWQEGIYSILSRNESSVVTKRFIISR
ncbi:MAG: T9SS type A sorting domain-containing protein [Bacteroidetes bacterium]|nr:T9SS type A sorting domain-containing protein [Bacteroidota bacterium]